METKEQLKVGREYFVDGYPQEKFKYAGVVKDDGLRGMSHHFVRANYKFGFIHSMHIPVEDLRLSKGGKITDCNRAYLSSFHYPKMIELMGDEEEFLRLYQILIATGALN